MVNQPTRVKRWTLCDIPQSLAKERSLSEKTDIKAQYARMFYWCIILRNASEKPPSISSFEGGVSHSLSRL